MPLQRIPMQQALARGNQSSQPEDGDTFPQLLQQRGQATATLQLLQQRYSELLQQQYQEQEQFKQQELLLQQQHQKEDEEAEEEQQREEARMVPPPAVVKLEKEAETEPAQVSRCLNTRQVLSKFVWHTKFVWH